MANIQYDTLQMLFIEIINRRGPNIDPVEHHILTTQDSVFTPSYITYRNLLVK